MVQFIRALKVKCVASAEYFPKNISPTEWYDVIGFETFNTKTNDQSSDKPKWRLVINFIVINDLMGITKIAAHNCQVVGDQLDLQALQIASDHEPKKETDKAHSQ